jgi:hypothetical protein
MSLLHLFIALLCLIVSFSKALGQTESLTLTAEAQEAINALKSDKLVNRKMAAASLRGMGPSDLLELELLKLTRSSESEVSMQADSILRDRLNNRMRSAILNLDDLAKVRRLMNERGIDFYAEWLGVTGMKATKEHWGLLHSLIDDSVVPEMKKRLLNIKHQGVKLDYYKKAKPVDAKDFFNAKPHLQPRMYQLCCDDLVEPETIFGDIIVSRGTVQSSQMAKGCLIVALGRVKTDGLGNCVVICDDEVCTSRCGGSVIVAAGNIDVQQSVQLAEWSIPNARDNFKLIRFSSLKDVGIELKEREKKWIVSELKDNSPFAESQVKVGDVVLAADTVPVNEPNTLRRASGKLRFQESSS